MSVSVLVTGASGFVGQALVARLVEESRFQVRAASRRGKADDVRVQHCCAPDLGAQADWREALQ
ncbi:MAG: NAD-dependent epimerase/dehydratase family protein, partial [Congregibacter sp.]|nr:NAD-dependent epimerase/dehydratase family protein [Congregibacter sp.]